jgi:hypothetical protein
MIELYSFYRCNWFNQIFKMLWRLIWYVDTLCSFSHWHLNIKNSQTYKNIEWIILRVPTKAHLHSIFNILLYFFYHISIYLVLCPSICPLF